MDINKIKTMETLTEEKVEEVISDNISFDENTIREFCDVVIQVKSVIEYQRKNGIENYGLFKPELVSEKFGTSINKLKTIIELMYRNCLFGKLDDNGIISYFFTGLPQLS